MKRKYNGLVAIVIIGTVLLPTAIYAVYSSQFAGKTDTTRLTTFPADFTVPDTAVMKKISGLEKEMVDIANPKIMKSMSVHDVRFWRYSDQNYHRYITNKQREEKIDAKTDHELTFTFASREKRFCIIDGLFYTQGAELPGGAKIVKIEPGRVRVGKGKSARWISLSETTKWGELQ
jgi:hypothetical protein